MNVLLTQKCVRSCPYCFASAYMSENDKDKILSWEDLIYIADLLIMADEKHISLLGGEPSLHPAFPEFILYLRERGFSVTVFTSGIMSEKTLDSLSSFLDKDGNNDGVCFSCNINEPRDSTENEMNQVERFLSLFGQRTKPSFNIFREDFDLKYLCEIVNQFKLIKRLRLGLAHPILGSITSTIPDSKVRNASKQLIEQIPLVERHSLEVNLDCGYPLCEFSDEDLGKLIKASSGQLKFLCTPAFDVGPDMNIWSCFPLSFFGKKSLYEFDSYNQALNYLRQLHTNLRNHSPGLYKECASCIYNGRLCNGGCIARMPISNLNPLENCKEVPVESNSGVLL